MIQFSHVSYCYPGAERSALTDISCQIPEGEMVLVAGPSGAGKSTLLRCINGLVPHFTGGELRGVMQVAGLNPVTATPKLMSQHVGFVFQDPETQFVMDRVEDEVAFALENGAMPPQEMRIRVEETLDLLDLAPLRQRPLDHLSGGERQRVAIAAALAFRPRILVLDEPTSQLDPKSAEDVLTALSRLNSDLGLTILLAEHRLERVLSFADSMLYIGDGGARIVYDEPRTVLEQVTLAPPLVQVGKRLGWRPLPLTVKEGLRHSRRMTLPDCPAERQGRSPEPRPYIRIQGVDAAYGSNSVLHRVSLEISQGEILAVMGRNGSGKTTLLKHVVGLLRPMRGSVWVGGRDIAGREVADICRAVAYLPQDPNSLLFADTVGEELQTTLRNHGQMEKRSRHELPPASRQLLATLGLGQLIDAYPRDLSSGERQRVALAAIMVTRPGALLLDEPTRGLDYGAKENLIRLLRTWRDEGIAIVVVTHDVEFAAAIADRVVLLSQGEVIAQGDPEEILGASPLFAPQVARLFPHTGWLTTDDLPDLVE